MAGGPPLYDMPEAGKKALLLKFNEPALINSAMQGARWFINSPVPLDYDNSKCREQSCIAEIKYKLVELDRYAGQGTLDIQADPALSAPGTHELIAMSREKLRQLQVVVRQDDTYVGYLTELLGVPFVYWPRRISAGHQTDLRLGADCVALIIYGRRRMGQYVPYVGPPKLYDYTNRIGDSTALSQARIKPGDILHFGFQTAVIASDNPPIGTLDDSDIIIQTYHKIAELKPFGELPYRHMHFDILRWP